MHTPYIKIRPLIEKSTNVRMLSNFECNLHSKIHHCNFSTEIIFINIDNIQYIYYNVDIATRLNVNVLLTNNLYFFIKRNSKITRPEFLKTYSKMQEQLKE